MTKKKEPKLPSIYDEKWIEKTAKEGFNRFWTAFKESTAPDHLKEEEDAKLEAVKHKFEFLYCTAFEDALNTFFWEVMEDQLHEVELALDEIDKLTAHIKDK